MKLNLGKMVPDYGSCEVDEPKEPKKMKKSYPCFYMNDVNLEGVDPKLVGKDITVTANIRIKEMTQRNTVKNGKESKQNDSMDIEVISIDFGKTPKTFKSLQDAIEDGLSEE